MANELTTKFSLQYAKSGDTLAPTPITSQVTITSGVRVANVQTVGTTYEALDIGDVASPGGMFMAINLDGTNYVEIGLEVAAAFVGFVKLLPGRYCFISGVSSQALFGRANTAACKVSFILMEP